MLALKQFVGGLVMPFTIALLLVAAGLILRFLQKRRASIAVLIFAALFTYFVSSEFGARLLLMPLTQQYPVVRDDNLPDVKYVVVLGSWFGPRADLSLTAAFDREGLARLVEGVRLFRKIPGSQLVVSGGALSDRGGSAPAWGYARLAEELGVRADSIIILDRALDTNAEAKDIAARLQSAPFLLVTSSEHMPRAMRLMKRAGANAIPAPATGRPGGLQWNDFQPDSSGLRGSEAAIHEYMGLAAIALGLN